MHGDGVGQIGMGLASLSIIKCKEWMDGRTNDYRPLQLLHVMGCNVSNEEKVAMCFHMHTYVT